MIGVAGFLVPGTHVDVLATIDVKSDTTTRTVVSNLQVLAAGTRYDQQEAKDGKADPDDRRDAPGDAGGRRTGGARVDRRPAPARPAEPAGYRADIDARRSLAALMGPPHSRRSRRLTKAAGWSSPPRQPPPLHRPRRLYRSRRFAARSARRKR